MLVYLALRELAFKSSLLTKPKKPTIFLQALIDLAPHCRTEKILLEFEQAVFQSFQKTFPEALLSGGFLYLFQSYLRKIDELDLQLSYKTNHDLALASKMLPSLAFEKKKRSAFRDPILFQRSPPKYAESSGQPAIKCFRTKTKCFWMHRVAISS